MTIETILLVVTTLGGWEAVKYVLERKANRRKTNGEAAQVEAEAKQAEVSAFKGLQEVYQETVDHLRTSRDEQMRENELLRRRQDETDERVRQLERGVARNERRVEAMIPFLCSKINCKNRAQMTAGDAEAAHKKSIKDK